VACLLYHEEHRCDLYRSSGVVRTVNSGQFSSNGRDRKYSLYTYIDMEILGGNIRLKQRGDGRATLKLSFRSRGISYRVDW
jgi:hypothetical protein